MAWRDVFIAWEGFQKDLDFSFNMENVSCFSEGFLSPGGKP